MEEARIESYKYFDKNIRKPPRNADGTFNIAGPGFINGDVDAFRHAYVSGIFTHEYGAFIADIFGRLNEATSFGNSTGGGMAATNMDYWNNAVGRKYGQKTRKKETLAKALHEAMLRGEMILNLDDSRRYSGKLTYEVHPTKSVIVLKESSTGRNEYFYDIANGACMNRSQFVTQIRQGAYPGYHIVNSHGIPTPVSKRDGNVSTNLG